MYLVCNTYFDNYYTKSEQKDKENKNVHAENVVYKSIALI
jgi:hypothetical protein